MKLINKVTGQHVEIELVQDFLRDVADPENWAEEGAALTEEPAADQTLPAGEGEAEPQPGAEHAAEAE